MDALAQTIKQTRVFVLAMVGCLCAFDFAQGATIIDISGLVNSDLTTYTGGSNYPQHGGSLTINGIPFTLATIGTNADTAVIQSSTTAGVMQMYTIPVGLADLGVVYTLINSAFGACGTTVGELDFIGTANTFAYTLTEGSNVRDHFNGQFCNTAPNVAGTASFGGGADRLDMQQITLPASFASQTLESIVFKSFGDGLSGSPFLAAVTVAGPISIPEPGTWTLLTGGIAAFVLLRRRRRPTRLW